VSFAVTPGRKAHARGSRGGLATFKLLGSGSYQSPSTCRSGSGRGVNGALVAATDFQGQHGCAPPHKIVQFGSRVRGPFILQLSNAAPGKRPPYGLPPPRRENYRLDRMYRLDGVRAIGHLPPARRDWLGRRGPPENRSSETRSFPHR